MTVSAFPLRLPRSIKAAVDKMAAEDGVSINQFIATAVAEKIGALNAATFFAARRQKADFAAMDYILARPGGEPPRAGDEMPEGIDPS
jgi:hypothetical protein